MLIANLLIEFYVFACSLLICTADIQHYLRLKLFVFKIVWKIIKKNE
jgi:hypothetical protein